MAEPHVLSSAARGPGSLVTVIEPTRGWRALDLRELWAYRELVAFLAWRDIKIRYKQTALGIAWAVLQPLLAMAVFSIIFGRVAQLPSEGVPYPLFVFAGLVPWFYFANATTTASGSLVANTNLISKVYFPRLVIPLAAVLGGLVDLAIGLGLELALLVAFGITPGARLGLLPLLVVLMLLTALSVSVWLAALDVEYRDVRYAVPFLVQIWLFITPIVYPPGQIPESWRSIFALNPMTGVVEGFRWALLDIDGSPGPLVSVSVLVVLVVLVTGLFYFRRMERNFADII